MPMDPNHVVLSIKALTETFSRHFRSLREMRDGPCHGCDDLVELIRLITSSTKLVSMARIYSHEFNIHQSPNLGF